MIKQQDLGLFIQRVVLGITMLLHGVAKVQNGISFIVSKIEETGMPGIFGYGVYIGEILAPILLLIGFRTRIAALLYALNCLVAIFLVHSQDIFTLTNHGGWKIELLGLYFFFAVSLIFTGGGKMSISRKARWD